GSGADSRLADVRGRAGDEQTRNVVRLSHEHFSLRDAPGHWQSAAVRALLRRPPGRYPRRRVRQRTSPRGRTSAPARRPHQCTSPPGGTSAPPRRMLISLRMDEELALFRDTVARFIGAEM